MNTTAAATQANVTVSTIRTWCRRGVITATKTAGRWIIDTASLTHRIVIAAMRHVTRKATVLPETPIHLTSKTRRIPGHIGAIGAADVLAEAFRSGTPVTLNGKFAGEIVYLGHRSQTYDDGITTETIGLDYEAGRATKFGGIAIAVYLVDLTRLDGAPRLAELVRTQRAASLTRAMAAEQRAAAEEDRYLNNPER